MASSTFCKFSLLRGGFPCVNQWKHRLLGQKLFIEHIASMGTLNSKFSSVELQRSCVIGHFNLKTGDELPGRPSRSWGCHNNIPYAAFHFDTQKLAGHNKWSKVKHIKGPKDAARSKEFNKISLRLKFVVQSDGPDPSINAELRNLLDKAKSKGMPKSTIEMIINKAVSGKDKYNSVLLEARGPAGSCFLIDVLSDNVSRTRQEIHLILKKLGCALGESGTSMYAFSKKGVIRIPAVREDKSKVALDDALEVAIETGAEDVQEVDDDDGEPLLMFLCDPKEVRQVRNELITKELHPVSVTLEYITENSVTLKDSQLENAAEIINQLSDHADVVKVYDNIASES